MSEKKRYRYVAAIVKDQWSVRNRTYTPPSRMCICENAATARRIARLLNADESSKAKRRTPTGGD